MNSILLSISCLVVFVASVSSSTNKKEEQCVIANWYDEKDKITQFNNILEYGLNSDFGRNMLKGFDPYKLNDKLVVDTTQRILGSDYDLKVFLEKVHVTGAQHVNVKPIAITSKESLAVDASINSTLHADVDGHFSLHQKSRADCKPDEEKWLSWCYRKCSLFPGMDSKSYRIGPQICARRWYSWKWAGKPFGCNGYGVSSDKLDNGAFGCPVKEKEQRTPKKVHFKVQFGVAKPTVFVDTLLRVKMCSGKVKEEAGKACVDLSAGEFLAALATKQFASFQKKAMKRVENIAIKKIEIDLHQITVGNIDLPHHGVFLNALIDLTTGLVKKLINNKKWVYEKVTSALENLAKTKVNDYLDTNLKPDYGSSCYDRRRSI